MMKAKTHRETKDAMLKARVERRLAYWFEHEANTTGLDVSDLVRRALNEFRSRQLSIRHAAA